jgi:hypothetical protein
MLPSLCDVCACLLHVCVCACVHVLLAASCHLLHLHGLDVALQQQHAGAASALLALLPAGQRRNDFGSALGTQKSSGPLHLY